LPGGDGDHGRFHFHHLAMTIEREVYRRVP
jgi:hypothetical protein